jgi:hypothetical protein
MFMRVRNFLGRAGFNGETREFIAGTRTGIFADMLKTANEKKR